MRPAIRSSTTRGPPTCPRTCRASWSAPATSRSIRNGPVAWVEIPPNVRGLLGGAAQPGAHRSRRARRRSTAILRVKAGWVAATLPAPSSTGRLSIDTSKLPFARPARIAAEIQRFVEELNGRLAANGKAPRPNRRFGPDGMT